MSDGQQTTQSKYRKKQKNTEEQPSIEANEVRIKGSQGQVRRYVEYACGLLEGRVLDKTKPGSPEAEAQEDAEKTENKTEDKPAEEQKFDTIVLKATGRAINKAVTTAEVVKRRVGGLHQVTSLETLEIADIWEPTEQGLKEVETKRRVASITITLSRDEGTIDKNAAGYQQPIPADAIKPFGNYTGRRGGYNNRRRGRGRGYNRRGGYRNNRRGGYGGGRGRGRGGYGRRGRGGYNNQDRSPPRSPGRGRRGGGGGQGQGGRRGRGGYGGQRRGGGYRGGYRDNRY